MANDLCRLATLLQGSPARALPGHASVVTVYLGCALTMVALAVAAARRAA